MTDTPKLAPHEAYEFVRQGIADLGERALKNGISPNEYALHITRVLYLGQRNVDPGLIGAWMNQIYQWIAEDFPDWAAQVDRIMNQQVRH